MRHYLLILLLSGAAGWLVGCGRVSDTNDALDPDTDLQTEIYTLTAQPSPPEGGIVEPAAGQFEEGRQVTVEAIPNQGWTFMEWIGDMQSTDNPLVFTIDRDTDLTASFADVRSAYAVGMRIADGVGELDDLEFGQRKDPFSEQAPPPPPEGAFHAYFYYNGNNLFKDYRSHEETEVTWELHYQAADGENLILSWEIEAIKMEGNLTLTDPDATIVVDMLDETSFEFQSGAYTHLLILYRLDGQIHLSTERSQP